MPARDGVQADVDAWREVSATTNLNDRTTTRKRGRSCRMSQH
jgi:hypothetical protein